LTYQIKNMKLTLSIQSSCKKSRHSSLLPKNWPLKRLALVMSFRQKLAIALQVWLTHPVLYFQLKGRTRCCVGRCCKDAGKQNTINSYENQPGTTVCWIKSKYVKKNKSCPNVEPCCGPRTVCFGWIFQI